MANLAAIESGALRDDDLAAVPGTSTHPAVGNRSNSAWYLAELGEFDRAVALGEEGVRLAEALGHAYGLNLALFHLGGTYTPARRWRPGGPHARACHGAGQGPRVSVLHSLHDGPAGAAYTLDGRAADGLPLLQEALALAAASTIRADLPLWIVWLAEAHAAVGQVAEAQTVAQRAVDLATTQGERANLAWAFRAARGDRRPPRPARPRRG